MVPETWSRRRGRLVEPATLAAELLSDPEVEGLTVSGGEPFEQPDALAALLGAFRAAGRNTWVYTGHTFEALVARGEPGTDAALSLTDVLVDGRYEAEKGGALRLRGSANQRILHLSGAVAPARIREAASAQVQVTLDAAGGMMVVGIPPPGFMAALHEGMQARGVAVNPVDDNDRGR